MITIIQKNTLRLELNVTDEDDNIVDINGYTFNFIAKSQEDFYKTDIKAEIDITQLIQTDEDGNFFIEIGYNDTKDVRPGLYKCQFQISLNNLVNTLEQDILEVVENYKKDI